METLRRKIATILVWIAQELDPSVKKIMLLHYVEYKVDQYEKGLITYEEVTEAIERLG